MMKWGIENEIVSGSVLVSLQAVAPLRRGRTEAWSKSISWAWRIRIDRCLPQRQVEIRSTPQKIVAMPNVRGGSELILESPFLAGRFGERDASMALALVGIIVDGDDVALLLDATKRR